MKTNSALFFAFQLYAVLICTAMAPMSIGIGVVLLGLILSWQSLKNPLNIKLALLHSKALQKLAVLSGLLALSVLVSLIGAKYFPLQFMIGGKAYGPELHFWSDLSKVWYLFWPFILGYGWLHLNEGQQNQVLKTWWTSAVLLCLLGLIQFFTGFPRPQPIPGYVGFFHVTGLFGHHLSFANIIIFPFFFGLYLFQTRLIKPGWLGFGSLVMLLALVGTFSRTLWLALPLAVFITSWALIPTKFKTVFVLICLTFSSLVFSTSFVQKRVFQRIGTTDRIELWKANFDFFKQRPFTGVGFKHNLELSGYYFQSKEPEKDDFFTGHAHNMILECMSGIGGFGLLSWVLLMGYYFWISNTLLQAKWLKISLFVFVINGMTQVNFWEAKVFHTFMWSISILFFIHLRQRTYDKA